MGCCGPVVIKLPQRFSNGEGNASVVGHREMSDAAHCDVFHVEIGMVESGVAAGHDEMVDVAVKRDEAGAAAWCRLGQLMDD